MLGLNPECLTQQRNTSQPATSVYHMTMSVWWQSMLAHPLVYWFLKSFTQWMHFLQTPPPMMENFITVFLKHHLYSKIRIWVFSCFALLMILHFVIFLFLLHKSFLQETSITWLMAANGNLGPYKGAGESNNMLSNGHIP